jgi:hypothetical protein
MKVRNILTASLVLMMLGCAPAGTDSSSSPQQADDVTGYAHSSPYNQIPLVNTVGADRLVTINVPLSALPNLGGDSATALGQASKSASNLPGLKLALKKDSQGRNYLAVTMPLETLAKIRKTAHASATAYLPNGNPLPGFVGSGEPVEIGSLPLGNVTLTLYASAHAFAVFAASPFSLPVDASFPISDSSGAVVGLLASVAPQAGFDGGFYVSFVYPPSIVALIGSLFP